VNVCEAVSPEEAPHTISPNNIIRQVDSAPEKYHEIYKLDSRDGWGFPWILLKQE
jgi:hypothetical protein